MTTIVYEGATGTLYTDSMVTSKVAGVLTRVDMTYKVEDLSRLKIVSKKGDRLVAMAFSGPLSVFDRAAKFIIANLHEWNKAHKKLADQGASIGGLAGSAVLLITSKHLYCFRFGKDRLEVEELDLKENVAFGSGGAFARTAMEVYGANGFDAIAAAAMCDPGTGCLVHSYRVVKNRLVPNDPILYVDSKEERLRMRKRAGKSTLNLEVAKLFDQAPENILVNLDENSPWTNGVRKQQDEIRKTAAQMRKNKMAPKTVSKVPDPKPTAKKVRN